ncbi:patatin-like phospholipase family protein [Pleionea litopenaei]|uniref:Patatin-like phospholipase family protein n=1 Tax=Pleionea litopenaei TaxID=3070815 RepID=A0AA51X7V8_9GAMM|nr:patatin-like phospholipase family protein [Pleionea sp. HL-JVS1]WMS88732.1 patatin-like phospholipase family protein [Pleionea sp. HL-JVS1]
MNKKIGLALGSGAARGISHFGIIRALHQQGVKPDIICGTSMGALIGAAYVTGHLSALEQWFKEQTTRKMLSHLDINLFASGGIADGEQFIHFLKTEFGDYRIEDLPIPFAAVACDMNSGKEVWLTEGSIWDAVRASGAYPGLLTPVKREHQWLMDGGVVNPVPVTVCRALGATHVIGVNLNHDLLAPKEPPTPKERGSLFKLENTAIGKVSSKIKQSINERFSFGSKEKENAPGIMDVIACTVNIMQDRITRSRLAGDPADIIFNPRLSHIGFLETDKSEEIINEGEQCVLRNLEQLSHLN